MGIVPFLYTSHLFYGFIYFSITKTHIITISSPLISRELPKCSSDLGNDMITHDYAIFRIIIGDTGSQPRVGAVVWSD